MHEQLLSDIQRNGFGIHRNFIEDTGDCKELQEYLSKADKFVDGVITDVPGHLMVAIHNKISDLIPCLAKSLGLSVCHDRFGYSSIRIEASTSKPILRQPFNFHQDPKVAAGGVLDWHLDHYSYYLYRDHKNWLICYIPIFKPSKVLTNLAIVPKYLVKKHDPYLFRQIEGRGAMRFRCAERDTIEWFQMRFPHEQVHVGDWFAIDDFDDSSSGFKLNIDLEAHKVSPVLEQYDLLIMAADVIHRTHDAGSDRISVRCDAIPLAAPRLATLAGLIQLTVQYRSMGAKRRYNIRKWLRKAWLSSATPNDSQEEDLCNRDVSSYLQALASTCNETRECFGANPNELEETASIIKDLLLLRNSCSAPEARNEIFDRLFRE